MKRQAAEWENMFPNHVFDKETDLESIKTSQNTMV